MRNGLKAEGNKGNTNNKDGIVVIVLYAILFLLVTYFHEPWFDEAQAWEIGKTATYADMLLSVTHTEGHPPLWSLILSIPAKLNVPYLIGLKSVSFIFSLISVVLIEIKSPFPRIVKLLLPFTYFIFYQYGIISRTYCVFILTCFLMASSFRYKDDHPRRFVLCLYILCLTSAYGIMIACGICICWIWDIIFNGDSRRITDFFRDKRIVSMLCLMILVILILFQISPPANAFALTQTSDKNMMRKLFYFIFVMIGDTFVSFGGLPEFATSGPADIIPGLLVSMIIYWTVFYFSERKKIKFFVIPFIMYSLFMSYYGSGNHTGIGMIFLITYAWATYDENNINNRLNKLKEYFTRKFGEEAGDSCIKAVKLFPVFIISVSVVYNIRISIDDIRMPYCEASAIAQYIKEHNMDDSLIMVDWTTYDNDEEGHDSEEAYEEIFESNNTFDAVAILPYFNKNIFFNHNINDNNKGYVSHLRSSYDENIRTYIKWSECGIPEVLIGLPQLQLVYGDRVSIGDYVQVATMEGLYPGKNTQLTKIQHIYVRKDCLTKFGITLDHENK